MKFIEYKDATGEDIKLSYQDYGKGQAIVLIHGWPLSKEMWEYQLEPLIQAGYRVIAYDRRGFGMSCKPWTGYDYDTLAADLKSVIEQLKLEDVILIGFSMGGGEIARYCSLYGTSKISKAVLISSVTPSMLQTEANPDGVPQDMFSEMEANIKKDRMAFLESFSKDFYGVNMVNHPVSQPFLQRDLMLASIATQKSTVGCLQAFAHTDFTKDMAKIDVPTLIIHGNSDKTVPIKTAGDRSSKMVTTNHYITYEGEPHGIFYTQKDRLNEDLITFLRK